MSKIKQLIDAGFENCIIFTPVNRLYFTGFEATDGILLITRGEAFLAMDSRYIEAAERKVTDCEVVPYNKAFYELCREDAVCENTITIADYERLKKAFAPKKITFSNELSEKIRSMRAVKTEDEAKKIRRAEEIGDYAFSKILQEIKPGVSETEIALLLEQTMRREGASGTSFETIVLSGRKGSMPHGVPDSTEIKSGDLVTMDFGCIYGGYCSDMTRTVAVGKPDSFQKEIYNAVLGAQLAALEYYKPGVKCSDADAAARRVLEDAGLAKYFGHALGHGVGLDIHEYPVSSPSSKEVFKAGNAVTDEPGVYIPGKAGVRIEDLVLITENGHEILSHSQKELIIL